MIMKNKTELKNVKQNKTNINQLTSKQKYPPELHWPNLQQQVENYNV